VGQEPREHSLCMPKQWLVCRGTDAGIMSDSPFAMRSPASRRAPSCHSVRHELSDSLTTVRLLGRR